MVPSVGLENAAQPVTIVGLNFYDTVSLKCQIGMYVVPGTFLSATHIVCITPAHVPFSNVTIEVTNNDMNYTSNRRQVRHRRESPPLSAGPSLDRWVWWHWLCVCGTV